MSPEVNIQSIKSNTVRPKTAGNGRPLKGKNRKISPSIGYFKSCAIRENKKYRDKLMTIATKSLGNTLTAEKTNGSSRNVVAL